MDKNYSELNKVFNVSGEIEKITPETPVEIVEEKPNDKNDIKDDYEYSRSQLYNLIAKGQEAIDGILDVAQASDHPRTYEVAGQLIKHVADVTDKLLDLQKKVKDINSEVSKAPTTVNNSLFVGSTAELQKLLKQQNTSQDK